MPISKKQSKVTLANVEDSTATSATKKQKEAKEKAAPKKVKVAAKTNPAANAIGAYDLSEIKKELYNEIKLQVRAEMHRVQHVTATQQKTETVLHKNELVLTGDKIYSVNGSTDGLTINSDSKTMQCFSTVGAVGFNTSAPKVAGPGSVHIKSNYNSEASLPTNGKGSVRGLLVESDADDQNSFLFRAVSRRNRQGLNLTGDGSLSVGLMHDDTNSRLNVYQPYNTKHAIHSFAPSRYYNANMIDLATQSTSTNHYNFMVAKNQSLTNSDQHSQQVFKVDGTGSVHTDKTVYSNGTGYAELYEWADGNQRKEDRTGFVVTISPKGKLVIANEEDEILGVISKTPAVVGNAAWNQWHGKYFKNENHTTKTLRYHVMEWETSQNITESFFNSSLDKNFIPPDNTVVYETHPNGEDMHTGHETSVFKREQEYKGRPDRTEWDAVVLTGSVIVCKGQITGKRWIKLAELSDDLERWLIR